MNTKYEKVWLPANIGTRIPGTGRTKADYISSSDAVIELNAETGMVVLTMKNTLAQYEISVHGCVLERLGNSAKRKRRAA